MSNGFVIAYLLGAAQGAFLAAVLAGSRRASVANRVLAAVMLAFAVDLAMAVYHAVGLYRAFPHLVGLDFPLAFLYGPLLYLYARTLSRRETTFRRAYLWHLAPFGALVLALLPFYLQSGAAKLAFLDGGGPSWLAAALGVVNHLKLVHALGYVGLTLALLRRHRRRVRDTHAAVEYVHLAWLRNLMAGIVGLMAVTTVLYLLAQGGRGVVMGLDPATVLDDVTLLLLALFVYAIGFMGLRQPDVFDGRRHGPDPPARSSADAPPETPRYAKSGMDPATARRYRDALVALMDAEAPYRRGDLTLQDLSDALDVSPHNLTEVINTQLGQNFYDFVNGYRVRDVQARLADPACAHLTLLAVAMDAGFNSKSAFNAVFKKHTGMTPSQFRAQAAGAASKDVGRP